MALTRAVILATISVTISLPLGTNSFRAFFAQGAEANEFPSPAWRPNQGPLRLADYVGRKVCAQCHPSEATTQPATPMAHAAEAVSECAILRKHPHFNFRLGPFRYDIDCRENRCIYSVSDGKRTLSTPILWAFGQGKAGQTYVLKWEESYYQSYVSFFSDTQTLDITVGFPRTTPPTLEAALGLPLSAEEAPNCFGCHTTAGVNRGRVVADRLTPGVSCEACHGPGGRHSAAMKSSHGEKTYIFSPAKLKPDDLADFCGACHRTSVQVQVMAFATSRTSGSSPTGWKKAAAGIQTIRASVVWRVITPTSSSTKTRLSTTRSAWLATASRLRFLQARTIPAPPVMWDFGIALTAICPSTRCQAGTSNSPITGYAS